MRVFSYSILIAAVVFAVTSTAAAELTVVSFSPARHALSAAVNANVVITFDRAVNAASAAQNIRVYGRLSGAFDGTMTLENGDKSVRFTPTSDWPAGETVTISMSHDLTAQDATTLRAAGYCYQFWIRTGVCTLDYSTLQVADVTGPKGFSPRPYGGNANDFNEDGSCDLLIVNEDSSDLRMMLNANNGSGMFLPYLTPTTPVGSVPSPNVSADFNDDGHTDIATANITGDSVSVALGNGDGTFQPRTDYPVGDRPRGIAALDADGDGDIDLAAANQNSGNVSILLNNGNGTFAAATHFDPGASNEYALEAGDMNNDGIFDLVLGTQSQQICVMLGNGVGTFTPQSILSAGGRAWMIVLADMNGDGNLDATSANGSTANGSILFGDGSGGISAPVIYAATGTAIATDVADLDGDGDMDWVLSSFGGGIWRIYTNNGAGVMTLDADTQAQSNPACALIVDVNNDRRMDLALIDEIADIITIKKNVGIPAPIPGDIVAPFGVVDVNDLFALLADWGDCDQPCPPACAADLTGDCTVNVADLFILLSNWG